MKIISFEGCIGSGKTSLTNYFAHEMRLSKVLEEYQKKPFLKEFCDGTNVRLETELTFLMIHYSQLKKVIASNTAPLLLADFSIQKDLVYANLNLNPKDLVIFRSVYDHVVGQVGIPHMVVYLDLSPRLLQRRISQRGRSYEMNIDAQYFNEYNDKVKSFFRTESRSIVHFFKVDDLEMNPDNEKLGHIKQIIQQTISKP